MGDNSFLLVEKDPPIGWLIFNRPAKLNAINAAMWQAIPERLAELDADPAVRVIVVRGAGERAFCVGADVSDFDAQMQNPGGGGQAGGRGARGGGGGGGEAARDVFQAFAECGKPTLAMIHGVCMGGGCAIALNIDIRLASEDAQFAITPARLGLGYPLSEVERAVEEIGPANTRYLLLTAARMKASKALELGLVQEVHPTSELEEATVALANVISENAPKTMRAIKESVRQSVLDLSVREPEKADALIRDCFTSEDFREGVRAFMEKRKPRFEDR